MQNQIVTYLKIQNKAHNQLGMKLLRTRVESKKIMLYQISLPEYIFMIVHQSTHVNYINFLLVYVNVNVFVFSVWLYVCNAALSYFLDSSFALYVRF